MGRKNKRVGSRDQFFCDQVLVVVVAAVVDAIIIEIAAVAIVDGDEAGNGVFVAVANLHSNDESVA